MLVRIGVEPDDGLGGEFPRLDGRERPGEADRRRVDAHGLTRLPVLDLSGKERLGAKPVGPQPGLEPGRTRLQHHVNPGRDRPVAQRGRVLDLEGRSRAGGSRPGGAPLPWAPASPRSEPRRDRARTPRRPEPRRNILQRRTSAGAGTRRTVDAGRGLWHGHGGISISREERQDTLLRDPDSHEPEPSLTGRAARARAASDNARADFPATAGEPA